MTISLDTPPSPTASWIVISSQLDPVGPLTDRLSPAERVVLHFLAQGLSNREIANVLGKSEATVKNQVSACLRKSGVPTRTRLLAQLR